MPQTDKLAQFQKMIGSSAHLSQRHGKLVEDIKSRATAQGISLSDSDIAESWAFRTCVYGNHEPDFDEIIDELAHTPGVIEHRAVQELLARLEDDPDALDDLSGAEKLKFARDHNLTAQASSDAELNDAQIAAIRDPGRKIAAHRAKNKAETKALVEDARYMSPVAKIAKYRRENGAQS